MAIPGVHGVCQPRLDGGPLATSGSSSTAAGTMPGDLTQGLGNTGEIVYGLFSLAERLARQGR